ncbi:hypothetical protein MnTg02_03356 [bacterium MnTg02]|nr:hypothetical protein MnTg02_03356 [bacterium MnTg02]
MNAVGQQRRGQRIAFDAGITLSLKAEGNELRALNTPAFGRPEGAHFFAPSISCLAGRGSPAL